MNLAGLVMRAARFWGEAEAVTDGVRSLSFLDIDDRSSRVAHLLSDLGAAASDRVAILIGNRLEWYDIYFGIYKAGLIAVGLDPRHSPAAQVFQIEDSQARILICATEYFDAIGRQLPGSVERVILVGDGGEYDDMLSRASKEWPTLNVAESHPAELKYTSGTEGRPKGVLHTHRARMAATQCMLPYLALQEDDVALLVGPLLRGSGALAYMCLASGARQVVRPAFRAPEVLELIKRYSVTTTMLVPTMLYMLLDEMGNGARQETPSLRTVLYASAPIAPARLEESLEYLGPVLMQSYGSTEAKGGLTFLAKRDHVAGSARLYSCGRSSLLAELRIVDESGQQVPPDEVGELVVKGPALFREYWRLPEVTSEAFTEDGWYKSGDIARMDERGYIYLMDRRRDMIVSGGINVFPIDVERALMAHSAVAEAAVFGVPHPRWGESVTAVVRLRTGMDAQAEELRNWLVFRLASYQVPKTIHLTKEDLPKNASGKVMRREIREPYWRGAARQIS